MSLSDRKLFRLNFLLTQLSSSLRATDRNRIPSSPTFFLRDYSPSPLPLSKHTFVLKPPRNSSPRGGVRLTHVRCVTAQCTHTHTYTYTHIYIYSSVLLSFRVNIDRGCNFVFDTIRAGHLSSVEFNAEKQNIWQRSLCIMVPFAARLETKHGSFRTYRRILIVLHLCARPFVLKFPALERRIGISVFSRNCRS